MMRLSKRWRQVLTLFGLTCLLTGCGAERPIDNRVMLFGLAFDRSFHHSVEVTGDQLNPLSSVNSTLQGGSSAAGPPEVYLKGRAPTVAATFGAMQLESPGDLDMTNLGVVVFSKAFAEKNGLDKALAYLWRDGHPRLLAFMVISQGSAEKLLKTVPKTSAGSAYRQLFLAESFTAMDHPQILAEPLWKVFRTVAVKNRDPVLPLVHAQKGMIRFDGGALFRHDRLVGTLTVPQAAIYRTVVNKTAGLTLTVPYHGSQAVIRLTSVHSSIRVVHGPKVEITLHGKAGLQQNPTIFGFPTNHDLDRIGDLAAQEMAQQINQTYGLVTHDGSDAFDVGTALRAESGGLWDQYRGSWPEPLKAWPYHVVVHLVVTSAS